MDLSARLLSVLDRQGSQWTSLVSTNGGWSVPTAAIRSPELDRNLAIVEALMRRWLPATPAATPLPAAA